VEIYETEEEQLEQLKKWWENNQSSVIYGVIGALVISAGVNMWQKHKADSRNQASQLYTELLTSEAEEKNDSVEKLAEKLQAEHGSSTYAQYAELILVKQKVQSGDLEGAKTLLQNEIKKNNSPEFKHIFRLRLIQLMLATKQYEQGLQQIAEVDPAAREGFASNYDELQGDLYLALDRVDEARNAYQSAMRSGHASPMLQFKLDDLTPPALEKLSAQ